MTMNEFHFNEYKLGHIISITYNREATWTHGGTIGADTDSRGRLRGTKDASDAYWANGYSGPRSQVKGGGVY